MTLEKAIETLLNELSMIRGIGMQKRIDAIKLGIEALKATKAQYDPDHPMMRVPLPGETY